MTELTKICDDCFMIRDANTVNCCNCEDALFKPTDSRERRLEILLSALFEGYVERGMRHDFKNDYADELKEVGIEL